MNNASTGANNSIISNMSPALVQKMLSQGAALQGFGGSSSASGRTIQPQSQPSSAQLRMLVQQIQMAVQAGYLNHQVFLSDFFFNLLNYHYFYCLDIKPTIGPTNFGTVESTFATNQEFTTIEQSTKRSSISVYWQQTEQRFLTVFCFNNKDQTAHY